ncbi:MAG: PPK2 family polyphosphate--nucleotide phosphotransferase [Chitinophagales bacterium]|nr:MAG: PPK2 family polyphosphate--nucleotide phosphotransferase [Chitinophagales bacterium]
MITLREVSPLPPPGLNKKRILEETEQILHALEELQNRLYAANQRSLLIVLQGLDASGKDGLIRHLFKAFSPMGCQIAAFKKPTQEELAHDFLWRIHKHTPQKGMIQIFNRSHYEDVLVPRVHGLLNADAIKRRYRHINNFEQLLVDHGTVVLKFYLHISPEEQMKRLKERLTNPSKNWKYDSRDLKERQHWNAYMQAYEDIFEQCSANIPWHIVPSDKNWYKEYLVSQIIAQTLQSLNLQYPVLQV